VRKSADEARCLLPYAQSEPRNQDGFIKKECLQNILTKLMELPQLLALYERVSLQDMARMLSPDHPQAARANLGYGATQPALLRLGATTHINVLPILDNMTARLLT